MWAKNIHVWCPNIKCHLIIIIIIDLAAMESSLQSVVAMLPTDAVADLISIGVCPRCIFRFLGIRDAVYSNPVSTFSLISCKCTCAHEPYAATEAGQKSCLGFCPGGMSDPCIVCLGILHTLDVPAEGILAVDINGKKNNELSTQEQILKAIKEESHQYDSFCLEVTVPGVILVRERSLWEYVQKKYGSESWLKGRKANEHVVSLKEALKWSLIEPLERILEARYDAGSHFRVVLIYKHHEVSSELDFLQCATTASTKRKLAAEETEPGESLAAVQRSLASMPSEIFVNQYTCPPSKVAESCQLTALCHRTSTYIGGRYLKLSRNISQSRWLIDDERMGDGSVEEIIADVVFPLFKADSYKFHAAGREDIDVRMLGSGRPFMLELSNARTLLSNEEVTNLENRINNSEEGWVKVRNLKLVGGGAWNLILEGEAEKQKQYTAVVWLSRSIREKDLQQISDLKHLEIQQRTPVRVLHRRSPLVRSRTIHWMHCERIPGTQQYFLLHLCTQAGTYIKEFVHGDLGRTHPNIGSLLGCEAEILQLDVTNIKMDLFD